MQEEDFLLGIKESLTRILDVINDRYVDFNVRENDKFKTITDPAEKLKCIKWYAESSLNSIAGRLADPEAKIRCGVYLGDMSRHYGHSFEQLKGLLAAYTDPKSPLYKHAWGFTPLLRWLYEMGNTSLGDVHADMPKHVVVTCHRPLDFASDEEYDAACKEYDDFWDQVEKLGLVKKLGTK